MLQTTADILYRKYSDNFMEFSYNEMLENAGREC